MAQADKKLNLFDIRWMWSLFGTAVGAGILFLPIKAGEHGFWPVVLMATMSFPMTWLSHRALARFVNAIGNQDITHAATRLGKRIGFLITLMYFFALYPICLAYGVGITNTVESFFANQLGLHYFDNNRFFLAEHLITGMIFVMIFNTTIVTRVANALVYPLALILLMFSLYLIPYWKTAMIADIPSVKGFFAALWFTLPVLVFSFNHSAIISTFAQAVEKHYGELKHYKTNQIELLNTSLLLFFVMFFVFSCILCLDPADFAKARAQNIPILSYFANTLHNPFIGYAGPIVAFLAITTSFFGHYYGAKEGLKGLIVQCFTKDKLNTHHHRRIDAWTTIFFWISIIAVAYYNPSILSFIEDLGGPALATITFILPIVAMYALPSMKEFRSPLADAFIFATGVLTVLNAILDILK
ncbi:aromatic amino acid transport family protein [Helicobacter ailurogastricus]|uniref:Serine transporter n=1 Tax=Helicobacter ailurogastricus TaxID=1578720 RepID=A0A0K2X5S0_9HELI|nr:aromatic amino acid transport family protein [Helicobacter ailurogastricus]CRF41371.1 Serine transporter [Helicobacter ailurogastricus]CRF42012.1 Serine transporter [Helicobacter ailurogastricus]CRF43622.1 Serine transporter [Helicobacter ailurogastricus]CRF52989.1 Serine transporter [Helicobacter ailurogastricus]GLH58086.1 Serine transporter SdaC [Helicobacter ailurogastricus]